MSNILLDYVFPITAIEPLPAANTGFLRQVLAVVKPKVGVDPNIVLCVSQAEVAALTDNQDVAQLFAAGLSRVFVLPIADLDLAEKLAGRDGDFFTVLISSDFTDANIGGTDETPAGKAQIKIGDATYRAKTGGTAGNALTIKLTDGADAGDEIATYVGNAIEISIESGVSTFAQIKEAVEASLADTAIEVIIDSGDENVAAVFNASPANLIGGTALVPATDAMDIGDFSGVVGVSSTSNSFLEEQAVIKNRVAFKTTSVTKGRNHFFAFGTLLSNMLAWRNQQYIKMPFADDTNSKGAAENLFDKRISFVMNSPEYGNVLSFFVVGGKAIIAPYVLKNLQIDMQSKGLQFISANQPAYTIKQATLLEDTLQRVIDGYIGRQLIESGKVEIKLEQANFVASGYIETSEPNALWRIFAEMKQSL